MTEMLIPCETTEGASVVACAVDLAGLGFASDVLFTSHSIWPPVEEVAVNWNFCPGERAT